MISSNSHRTSGARNLRDQSRRVLDDVKQLGSIAVDNVGDGTERLKERGREILDSGRETVERYQGQVKKYIAANPFKSLLLAVGVGTLVGLALRRRS
jgi:ElaB/YqjD/DUF883 family membrane-anchored ribosome-binding protein